MVRPASQAYTTAWIDHGYQTTFGHTRLTHSHLMCKESDLKCKTGLSELTYTVRVTHTYSEIAPIFYRPLLLERPNTIKHKHYLTQIIFRLRTKKNYNRFYRDSRARLRHLTMVIW